MVALPLEQLLPDIRVNGDKFLDRLVNLSGVYSLPFDPDIVYDIFDNCDELEKMLKSTSRGSGINGERAATYTMNGDVWLYYPRNINDFLIDCFYVWEIQPIFEPNLIKRNFKTY